jgi:hypothetical protein
MRAFVSQGFSQRRDASGRAEMEWTQFPEPMRMPEATLGAILTMMPLLSPRSARSQFSTLPHGSLLGS